jgi:hypothetical protein
LTIIPSPFFSFKPLFPERCEQALEQWSGHKEASAYRPTSQPCAPADGVGQALRRRTMYRLHPEFQPTVASVAVLHRENTLFERAMPENLHAKYKSY